MVMNNINAIKFISEGTSIISLAKIGEPSNISLEYSYNGIDWDKWDLSTLTINSDDTLYIRGYNPNGFSDIYTYYSFLINGDKVSCSGNIMSLIDYKNLPDVIPCSYCFYKLFENCALLTTAPELPATILADSCYEGMFLNCTALTTAPKLPATKLINRCYLNSCYYQMFSGCTALTNVPVLPATILSEWCYSYMFKNCTSLKNVSVVQQTNITDSCYYQMFSGRILLKVKQFLMTIIKALQKPFIHFNSKS